MNGHENRRPSNRTAIWLRMSHAISQNHCMARPHPNDRSILGPSTFMAVHFLFRPLYILAMKNNAGKL